MEGRQRIRRRFVQNAGVGRFGDAFINVGKYRQHGLRQIQMGVAFSPADDLAGIHNDIHRVGGVDPHESGSVFPNNGFPGRMIGDTRHRQTVFSLEGGDGGVMQCNVSDFAACEAWMKEILALYGKIDILVNNAGITKDGLLMGMSEEAFDRVIETNLKGTFNCIRFAARPMIRQKSGCIINMASVVGVAGNAGQANYAASKAGVIGLTKTAARELASRGIRVNAIAPGFIETDMTEVLSDKVKEASVSQIPLGHFGKPEDVANLAAFLASEAAAYITGQVIHCDGGMVI